MSEPLDVLFDRYGDGHDRFPVLLLSCTAEFLDERYYVTLAHRCVEIPPMT